MIILGTWDYEPPECMKKTQHGITKSNSINCPINQLPAAPNNGYIDLKSLYAAGNGTIHFVEYKCRPGYKLYGDNVSSCIIDGYWTQPNTTCRGKSEVFSSLLNKLPSLQVRS